MAIVALPAATDITAAGATPVYTGSLSAANTYTVPCDGRTFLHVKNAGGSPCTVTVITPNVSDGLAIADQTVVVIATTGDMMIGRLNPFTYSDPLTGLMSVTFSFITSVTVAVLRLQ